MKIGKYIKAAFVNHWNLLVLAGGTAFAFLSGRPDIVLPFVAAGELAYLGMLGTHPKFQKAIEARDAKARRAHGTESAEQAFQRISRDLPDMLLNRYYNLRKRCIDLREIAQALRQASADDHPFEKLQHAGLDRLLWIYLRLLYTKHSLGRFLAQTSERSIRADIERLGRQLADYDEHDENPRRRKARASVADNLGTSQLRLQNLLKARENHELIDVELDSLENKIQSLSELAVNRQEPQFISDQVDAVASSMLETERTMSELSFLTGFGESEAVPELLDPPRRIVAD